MKCLALSDDAEKFKRDPAQTSYDAEVPGEIPLLLEKLGDCEALGDWWPDVD